MGRERPGGFAVDPGRAVAELHRVLRPGGRVGVAVWAAKERNPWLGLVLDAVAQAVGHPVPLPGMPGPFALGDESCLRELFVAAGFADVAVAEDHTALRAPSFDAWWERTTALTGPVAGALAGLDPATIAGVRAGLHRDVAACVTPEGHLELPSCRLVATAHRP